MELCFNEYLFSYKNGDYHRAFPGILKCAELKIPFAMETVGKMYFEGLGTLKNLRMAEKWFKEAIYKGHECHNNLGLLYCENHDYHKAFTEFALSKNSPNPKIKSDSLANIGHLYYDGTGVAQNYKIAFEYYSKAGKNQEAYYGLAQLFENGFSVSKNPKKAFEYYLKSADLGDMDAVCQVGFYYGSGLLGLKNDQLAISWYEKGVLNNHPGCMANLSAHYWKGNGVKKDVVLAGKLLLQCARHNGVLDEDAKESLVEVADMYFVGDSDFGVSQNYQMAVDLYLELIELNIMNLNLVKETFLSKDGVIFALQNGNVKENIPKDCYYCAKVYLICFELGLLGKHEVLNILKKFIEELKTRNSGFSRDAESAGLIAILNKLSN